MPAALSRALRAKAKSENITFSELAERAIRKQLPLIERAFASSRAQIRPSAPAQVQRSRSEIPKTWKEVASIDFTGYLGRDCDERIIYKTPDGALKARPSSITAAPSAQC